MMKEKICLVTGASSGIGEVTADELAQRGATVLFLCRSREKGEAVVQKIAMKHQEAKLDLFVADLGSQAEVCRLAAAIKSRYPRIDVLINNAGAINPERVLTVDGIETTFAVNHLAHFLLTNLLLGHLKAAPAGRIINVSSQVHRYTGIDFEDLALARKFSPLKSYAQSKLANIFHAYELARRFTGSRITVNTLHPGSVASDFGLNLTGALGLAFKAIRPFMRTCEKGAETVVWLATSPEVEGVTGKYFLDRKEIRSSSLSYNLQVAEQLWDISTQLTEISD